MSSLPPKPPPPPDFDEETDPGRASPAFGGAEASSLEDAFPPAPPPDDHAAPIFAPPPELAEPPPPPEPPVFSAPDPPPAPTAQEIHATPSPSITPPAPPFGGASSTPRSGPPIPSGEHALAWGDPATKDDKNLALAAHLGNVLFPIVPPLVIWLLYRDRSKFISYHALQALVMNLLFWLVAPTLTCGVGLLLSITAPILSIVWGLKAYDGKWEGFPLIEKIGR